MFVNSLKLQKSQPGISSHNLRHENDFPHIFAVSGAMVSIVATGIIVITMGPHTAFQEYTQFWYQQFHQGFKVKVNRKLKELMFEVIEDAEQLTPTEQEKTKSFMANTQDIYAWGGYSSIQGVLLMLPYFFAYQHTSDVNLQNMGFGHSSADGEAKKTRLSRSLLESEAAKVNDYRIP